MSNVNKRVAPMWLVEDKEYKEWMLYHYSDEQRAKSKGDAKLKWVGVDNDYFIGTVQPARLFEGFIFDTEEEANKAVGC